MSSDLLENYARLVLLLAKHDLGGSFAAGHARVVFEHALTMTDMSVGCFDALNALIPLVSAELAAKFRETYPL